MRRAFGERASEWAAGYSEPASPSVKTLMARQRFVLGLVEGVLPRGSRILDLGCGPGEMAAALMRKGYEVWGLDIAEPMIRHARARCGVDRFRVGDIEQIPFPDSSFDGVVCLGVLEYLDADEAALREMRRVLKPEGAAIVATPSAVCPLYHVDRVLFAVMGAMQPLYDFAKYRLRGRRGPVREAKQLLTHRRYRRGSWLRRLRSQGLDAEEWLCYGWGWYRSQLGALIEIVSAGTGALQEALERRSRHGVIHKAGHALARNSAFNWIGYEQLVRLRASR